MDPRGLHGIQIADDMCALTEQAFGRPVVIAGHYSGGLIAALLAVRNPDLVRGVVFEDARSFRDCPTGSRGPMSAWMRMTGSGRSYNRMPKISRPPIHSSAAVRSLDVRSVTAVIANVQKFSRPRTASIIIAATLTITVIIGTAAAPATATPSTEAAPANGTPITVTPGPAYPDPAAPALVADLDLPTTISH